MYGSLENGTEKKINHRIKDVSFSRTSLLPNNAKLLRERAVSVYIYVCIYVLHVRNLERIMELKIKSRGLLMLRQ